MSFRTRLLPVFEQLRGKIPGALDLRPYSVTVRVRTWTGARPGIGTYTDADTVLMNAGVNPRVQVISTKDVIASGGRYAAGDFRIGPLTPAYTSGGTSLDVIDPPRATTAREVFFILSGPGFPPEGAFCKRVEANTFGNFRSELIVRRTGERP